MTRVKASRGTTFPELGRGVEINGAPWKTQSDSLKLTRPVWKFCIGIWEQLVQGSLRATVFNTIKQICSWDPGWQGAGGWLCLVAVTLTTLLP